MGLFDDVLYSDTSPTGTESRRHGLFDDVLEAGGGAALRAAGRATIPTATGFAAAIPAGEAVTALTAPFLGPAAPLAGLAAGLGAGYFGSRAGGLAQEMALQRFAPSFQQELNRQQALDIQEHPVASFFGQLIPQAALLRVNPANVARAVGTAGALVRNLPAGSRLPFLAEDLANLQNVGLGAGVMGGVEAFRETAQHEPLSPAKIIGSAATGGLLNEPTRLGRVFLPRPNVPTVNEPTRTVAYTPSPSEQPLDTSQNVYVKTPTLEIPVRISDHTTANEIRQVFAGDKNEQIVRGAQLAEAIKRAVPNLVDRQGMFWALASNGDAPLIQQALADPKFSEYVPQLEAALHLPPNAQAALRLVQRYYQEAGIVGQQVGTLRNIRENYQNRIYQPEPPKDYVKTELLSGLKQTTAHAKPRIFDTEFQAVEAGKRFATTDVADALSVHNEEMARVNTSRALAETLVQGGLAAWKRPDNIPDGWQQVGLLSKSIPIKDANGQAVIGEGGNQIVSQSVLAAPQGIAKGLAAIADPNFARRIDTLRHVQNYQGLVKTVDLGLSFFHHFTMAAQTLYQGGVRTFLRLPVMSRTLASPEFGALEQDFVRHVGMTSKVQANQDILRNLVSHERETFGNIVQLPGVRHILQVIDRSAEFLFGKIQRFLKVTDYGAKTINWVAEHPTASNAEVLAAKRGFAREVNAAYGGLNWEAMGVTKSNLSLLRLGLLAPDWTISNGQLLAYAVGGSGTAGQASRSHILTALLGGMVLTEGLNKILTGHFTDENKRGHQLEIEVQPNVYISLLRGGIGDITKLGSMIAESGLAGVSRFAQGKLAPLPRTAAGLLTNVQYTGGPIAVRGKGPIQNTFEVLKYALSNTLPVPFGASNVARYQASREPTALGRALVGTGLGRFSKPFRRR